MIEEYKKKPDMTDHQKVCVRNLLKQELSIPLLESSGPIKLNKWVYKGQLNQYDNEFRAKIMGNREYKIVEEKEKISRNDKYVSDG